MDVKVDEAAVTTRYLGRVLPNKAAAAAKPWAVP